MENNSLWFSLIRNINFLVGGNIDDKIANSCNSLLLGKVILLVPHQNATKFLICHN